jgi:hypothetical protein
MTEYTITKAPKSETLVKDSSEISIDLKEVVIKLKTINYDVSVLELKSEESKMSETTTTKESLETTEFEDMTTTEKIFKKRKTKENLRTTATKVSKLSEPIITSTEVLIMT